MKRILIFLTIIFLTMSCTHAPKTAFVVLGKLYDKFPMKKDMETKLDQMKNMRKGFEDSIAWRLKTVSQTLPDHPTANQIKEFENEKMLLEQKQDFFEKDNQRISEEYNSEIWKQINQYVKDYGEENGYDYIYGAEGSGALMYSDKKHDITDEVSKYLIQRFEGKKK